MANRSRLSVAKPRIEAYFNNQKQKVYSLLELQRIFSLNRTEWLLARTTSAKEFIEYLLNRSKLKKVILDFPTKPITKYIWDNATNVSVFEVGLSLSKNCYLSHYTAMYLYDLTEQIPKNIYITDEQGQKSSRGLLTQESIDEAFTKSPRLSQNTAAFNRYKITLLNGMYTDNTGVITFPGKDGLMLNVTNLERTLIDIAVRPAYSGGIFEVLKAFRFAKERASVNKIKSYLKKISFIYPYHQVMGLYLDLAGYGESRTKLLLGEPMNYNFYLTNEMKDIRYSEKWKLYYPAAIENVKD